MRVHSNVLDWGDIGAALRESVPAAHIDSEARGVYGSRSHARAFEVRLRAPSGPDRHGTIRRWPMTGTRGADTTCGKAATYCEWGDFIVALFERDPNARVGPYKSHADFHRQTRGEFMRGAEDFLAATS